MGIKSNGFTLAEVLITLVIIGVIAALTIPSLMNNTNEQESVIAVKKVYSMIGQAYQRIKADNGEINPSMLGDTNEAATKKLGEMFVKQLNTQKICGQRTGEDCWSTQNGGIYKRMDGNNWNNWNNDSTQYKMVLSDGRAFAIYGFSSYQVRGDSEPLNNVIGYAQVDINGDKSPNQMGKDCFAFWITKYGIIPFGTPDDTEFPLSECRTKGTNCTAWVVTKGNMDYLKKDINW